MNEETVLPTFIFHQKMFRSMNKDVKELKKQVQAARVALGPDLFGVMSAPYRW